MIREAFEEILRYLLDACVEVYKEDLITLAIFGSVARGTPNPESDIDLLLVVKNLPSGRLKRVQQFEKVESIVESHIRQLKKLNITTWLSPVIKTPEEVRLGSLLFLDMTEYIRILYDKNEFFHCYLDEFSSRLKKMGAYKISDGERWHWVLKPDYKPGEVFEI